MNSKKNAKNYSNLTLINGSKGLGESVNRSTSVATEEFFSQASFASIGQLIEAAKMKIEILATEKNMPYGENIADYTIKENFSCDDNVYCQDESEDIMSNNEKLENEIVQLRHEIEKKDISLTGEMKTLSVKIDNSNKENMTTRWILGVLITIFALVMPILFNMHAKFIDSKMDSIDSKFGLIQQQFQSQKEINSMQIERDVAKYKSNQK